MDAHQLYDEDFLLWTEQQADALRRLGQSNSLDIAHLAEEIEDLGRRDLHDVESFIELILLHCLKVVADPTSEAVRHWEAETIGFQTQLRRRFTPSMTGKLDLNEIWRDALRRFAKSGPQTPSAHSVSNERVTYLYLFGSPLTLDDIVDASFDLDRILAKLASFRTTNLSEA